MLEKFSKKGEFWGEPDKQKREAFACQFSLFLSKIDKNKAGRNHFDTQEIILDSKSMPRNVSTVCKVGEVFRQERVVVFWCLNQILNALCDPFVKRKLCPCL